MMGQEKLHEARRFTGARLLGKEIIVGHFMVHGAILKTNTGRRRLVFRKYMAAPPITARYCYCTALSCTAIIWVLYSKYSNCMGAVQQGAVQYSAVQ